MNHIINISTFELEDSIGALLHPNTPYRFYSILGPLYSLSNGMFFLNSTAFKIGWLDSKITNDEFKIIRRSPKRNVPNYWEIVKLLITDRIVQDKPLLIKLVKDLPEDVDNVLFNPVLKIKRGILTEVIKNDKLYIYGLILSRLVQFIVKYLRGPEIGDYENMTDAEYKQFVQATKEYIWEDVKERSKGNILSVINDSINDDDLLKEFMAIRPHKLK